MNTHRLVPEMPLCSNILRLQSYLLAPDELVFFDWLVVKQIAFHYKDFHYSQARTESETRIKRSRQEAILEKFKSWGLVTVEVRENAVTKGQVRYFRLSFSALADKNILNHIIDPKTPLYIHFLDYANYHAKEQSRLDTPVKSLNIGLYEAEDLCVKLDAIYDERRRMYNDGELSSGEKPEDMKPYSQLSFNKTQIKGVQRLMKEYEIPTIKNAFAAYLDEVFVPPSGFCRPRNIVSFFLSYNKDSGAFKVFEYYLNIYNMEYSRPR